jgi:MoxR-like ATPase
MSAIIEPTTNLTAPVAAWYQRVAEEARKALVGQDLPFQLITVALLARGHVLLEGVPGTAKTLMAKTLAHLVQADFTRVQFTPDLMPSDVIGTYVYQQKEGDFRLRKGPIFTNILLGDEINRAPAKTQSAMLEAMEERQVTIEGNRFPLPTLFMVLATQNPVEFEGTYPLPEAQLDRFLLKVPVTYAPLEAERALLRRINDGFDAHNLATVALNALIDPREVVELQGLVRRVKVEDGILTYITAISDATRNSNDLLLGGSPRASIALLTAAKAFAAVQGRDFLVPDDIKFLVPYVFSHRILLRPEAEIEGLTPTTLLERLLSDVEVPR